MYIPLFILIAVIFPVFAFDSPAYGIKSVVIDDFENDADWEITAGPAKGIKVMVALRDGCPAGLAGQEKNTLASAGLNPADQKKVLGIKIELSDIDEYQVLIEPEKPDKVKRIGPGMRKVSAWVYGKNTSHVLYAVVGDKNKKPLCDLLLGKLNYYGWNRLSALYPSEYLGYPDKELYFLGFKLILDPMELRKGVFYFYLDFISVEKEILPDE